MRGHWRKTVVLTLDQEIVVWLKKLAAEEGRSLSRSIDMVLHRWLTQAEQKENGTHVTFVRSSSENPEKQQVGVTLEQDFTVRLRELAEADYRTFSEYINLILRQCMAAQRAEKD